ncbi:hypothetical protein DB347_20525 [Opitutaceae bacterium EW11]|nr:hypothetical protein DB347_20525 [Opitutaceae bacterium EW11]
MRWLGKWRNQYGSILEITQESDGKIAGVFRTALEDSGFFGQQIPVYGFGQGDCIGLSGGGTTPAGDSLVTYTGLLREGKLETLWFVVTDAVLSATEKGEPAQVKKLPWWRSMSTNADTFERAE